MCHAIQSPPTLPVTKENVTSTASVQWKRRSGASQTGSRMAPLLVAVVVVAGLAGAARFLDRLLERLRVAGRLRQRLHGGDHLVHLRVEVGALLPDLRLRLRLALVRAVAEELARVVRNRRG